MGGEIGGVGVVVFHGVQGRFAVRGVAGFELVRVGVPVAHDGGGLFVGETNAF